MIPEIFIQNLEVRFNNKSVKYLHVVEILATIKDEVEKYERNLKQNFKREIDAKEQQAAAAHIRKQSKLF